MYQATHAVVRKPAVPLQPVVDPAAWTKEEVAASNDWIYHLSDAEIADLDRAIKGVEARGLDIIEIRREDFPLPTLGPSLLQMREELLNGRGFVLIRGFPVERYNRIQVAAAFFGMGTYVGRTVSQNAKGHVLGHVKKLTDSDYNKNADERGYRTNNTQRYHSDSCDMVGLLCLHPAKSGGLSSIVSSVTVHNVMLSRRPDLVKTLSEPLYWDRRGEIPVGKDPWYILPIFNYYQEYFTCRYGRIYINSTQRFPQVPRFTPQQVEAMDYMDTLLEELHFDMKFQRGDIQLLHNHVTLHQRTAFEDYPEPERKRHLLRLWMTHDGARPIPPAFLERINGIVTATTRLKAPLEAE